MKHWFIMLLFCAGIVSAGNTPESLREKFERQAVVFNQTVEDFGNHVELYSEKEMAEMLVRASVAIEAHEAAGVEILACESFGQGDYCDDAEDNLKRVDAELEKLSKFRQRIKPDEKDI